MTIERTFFYDLNFDVIFEFPAVKAIKVYLQTNLKEKAFFLKEKSNNNFNSIKNAIIILKLSGT